MMYSGISAVSYTHLDVYKRQVVYFVKMYIVLVVRYVFILGQRISVLIGHDYRILMSVGIEPVQMCIRDRATTGQERALWSLPLKITMPELKYTGQQPSTATGLLPLRQILILSLIHI